MCAIWLAAVDGSSPPAKLTAITLTASLIDQAERFLPELVTSARLNGHTWRDIAQALATSPDEARLRLDPTPGRRRPLALRHLKPQRRGHFKCPVSADLTWWGGTVLRCAGSNETACRGGVSLILTYLT
jgi:hypothetical protein